MIEYKRWAYALPVVSLLALLSLVQPRFQTNAQSVPALAASANAPAFVRGRVLVKFRAGVSKQQAHGLLAKQDSYSLEEIPQLGIHVVRLPASANEEAFVNVFKTKAEVEFAELDRLIAPAAMTPNDPWYPNEWHLTKISAPTAWTMTTGSNNITVAILDTGVDSTHPDLAEKIVPGWNVYDNNSNTSDVAGHGTAVAGVVGASSNNSAGVASVAWGCQIMPVRISDTTGNASYSAAASGLMWAADHGARVANISYIVTGSSAVTSAASYFQSKGGVVTVSAGNYSTFDASADNPYVLTVSGINGSDVIWPSSNTGNNVDICAPYYAYTTIKGGTYSGMTGTSVSAPMVAGVAALLLSANPALSPQAVQDLLKQSADDLGTAGWDASYGAGRVNAARALSLVTGTPPDTTAPVVTISTPAAGATISGNVTVQVTATDNVGVNAVSLSVDGVLLGTDTTAPYSFAWDTTAISNGTHTLATTASDAAGNAATQSCSVIINNLDITPPTVTITAPTANSTVSGTATVQISANDNAGVAYVSLNVDGALFGTDTVAPYSFAWNTAAVTNGSHTLTATVKDAAGNAATSTISVLVSNADSTPPTVNITAPTASSTVAGTVTVQATANDNVGVSAVIFSVDGVAVGTDTTAPYSFAWNTTALANGLHTLAVTARDAANNSASNVISVTVNNPVLDKTAPTISITAPTGGNVSGTVSVLVNAKDNVAVTRVELYVDGVLVSTVTAAPFTNKWNTKKTTAGPHTLQCRAYDAAGNVGASTSVIVYK